MNKLVTWTNNPVLFLPALKLLSLGLSGKYRTLQLQLCNELTWQKSIDVKLFLQILETVVENMLADTDTNMPQAKQLRLKEIWMTIGFLIVSQADAHFWESLHEQYLQQRLWKILGSTPQSVRKVLSVWK